MLKILLVVVLVGSIFGCKWVCVDEKHRIVKEYIDSASIEMNYPKQEITVPQIDVKRHSKGRRRKWKNKSAPPEVKLRIPEFLVEPTQEMCRTEDFRKTMKEMTKKVKCKPRETIVDIKYKGGKVVPGKISTKLCSGGCSGTKTCLSVERRNISLSVSVLDSSNRFQCSQVLIPKDIKCKCGCDKSMDCLVTQVFDKKFCKCKCINEEEHRMCVNKMANHINKFLWDKSKCSCECKNERICTTGTEWDKSECKCIRT